MAAKVVPTAMEQDAAHHWERLVTLNLIDGAPTPTLDEILSDDELLAELLA